MNEITQKEMEEYLASLPQKTKDVVLDDFWQKRTKEIAVKYSLSEEQSTTLQNLVLFVIIGVENPGDLEESLKNELGVSELLAEQIGNDLDVRVFGALVKNLGNKEEGSNNNQKITNTKVESGFGHLMPPQPNGALNIENEIPEVRPETVPMVEKGEMAHDVPPPAPVKTEIRPEAQNEMTNDKFPMTNQIQNQNDKAVTETVKPPEPAPQQPTPVPKPSAPQEPPTPPVKKYAVDPYREPLE